LREISELAGEVQDLTGLRRGRIRIGATPSLLASLLSDALATFHARFGGIEMSVTQGGSRDLVNDLAAGELDLAVIVLPLQTGDPSLETQPVLREELVIAAPPRLAAAAARPFRAHPRPGHPPPGDVPSGLRPAGSDDHGLARGRA
jgi:DNA-binding transcriptional LysR family regulator